MSANVIECNMVRSVNMLIKYNELEVELMQAPRIGDRSVVIRNPSTGARALVAHGSSLTNGLLKVSYEVERSSEYPSMMDVSKLNLVVLPVMTLITQDILYRLRVEKNKFKIVPNNS